MLNKNGDPWIPIFVSGMNFLITKIITNFNVF